MREGVTWNPSRGSTLFYPIFYGINKNNLTLFLFLNLMLASKLYVVHRKE